MLINNKDVFGRSQDINKMPGHWLLAKLGKRILRPGGRELTNKMLDNLEIQSTDKVIEFAPGLGYTTQLTLRKKPSSYIAIERDEAAANSVRKLLKEENHHCHIGFAEETGLPNESATVIYGEAMLTMQTPNKKQLIVNEASRLLYPGGRYGIHELCLVPDDIDKEKKENICNALTDAIHVGVRPLTVIEWRELLESQGFVIKSQTFSPMHLLEPKRLIQDEGFFRALHFVWNVLTNYQASKRVRTIRRVFKTYADNITAITLVGVKS